MKPRYCPNCGEQIEDAVEFETAKKKEGWDCYCSKCGWSGDILPDEITARPHTTSLKRKPNA